MSRLRRWRIRRLLHKADMCRLLGERLSARWYEQEAQRLARR